VNPARITAPPITVGGVRASVEWRDLGYDSGIAIRVALIENGSPVPVAKLDAFTNRPHLHLYRANGGEQIRDVDGPEGAEWCVYLLEDLPALLRAAGRTRRAAEVEPTDVAAILVPAVRAAIHTLDRGRVR
jgi:hypothetical protein